ncbi:MAG TPA: outer membrane beta-barrel protein [Pyrinomonadaceae bacterium]|nr:outer membrane beta-barrel protein [Pyrinomonadaceae bacterium]
MLKHVISCLSLLLLLTMSVSVAHAQSDEKKFEVGGQFSLLGSTTRTASSTVFTEDRTHVPGFGGRFGYNASKYFALEAEVNFFPRDRDLEGGQKFQGLFGVKAGKRFEKVGVFGKARPGFIRFDKGDYVFGTGGCITVFPPPLACYRPVATTNFAADLGGVFELYPSDRTLVRFDVGDTIIHFNRRNVAATSTVFAGLVVIPAPAETKHNLQFSAGFGFRF